MRVRWGICCAGLLIAATVSWTARCETPPRRPDVRLDTEHPPRILEVIRQTSGPFPPPAELRRLPALSIEVNIESSAAATDGAKGRAETLQQAWRTALDCDQRLEATWWDLSSAEHSLQSARAQRWPTVAVESSYVARTDEPAFRFRFPGIPLPTDRFAFAQEENAAFRSTLDLPLWTGGRIDHGIAAASADVTSAALEVEGSTSELKMRVAEVYVAVLRAQRDVEVTRSNVKSLQAHARRVELLFQHEQVPENDLLAAEVALASARQRAIQADNRLDTSRAAYNRYLGRRLTTPVRIAELPVETVAGEIESLTSRAVRTRPELARLAARILALRHQADSLLAENHPQVKLQGEYAFEENRFRSPEGIASLGVGVWWNAFDGGQNRHQVEALRQRAESLQRVRADLRSRIALEVHRAWLDIQETRRRLEVTSQAIRQAEENLRVAKQRYASGVGINTEVLDAETLRTETYRNHFGATYDAVLAVLRLRRATGEL